VYHVSLYQPETTTAAGLGIQKEGFGEYLYWLTRGRKEDILNVKIKNFDLSITCDKKGLMTMLSQETVNAVLKAARETGGDFAELYLEDTLSNSLKLVDGRVEDATSSHSRGAGVRVFAGLKTAYAYTADTSLDSLLATARAAGAAVSGSSTPQDVRFEVKNYARIPGIPADTVSNAARIAVLKTACEAAKAVSDEIRQVQVLLMDVDKTVLVANSEGVYGIDRRPRVRLYVQAVASDGKSTQTGTEGPGFAMGYEALDLIDIIGTAQTAARRAVTMLHAPECPASNCPVVIDGGFGGVIFHEACGHSLEATSVSRGNSEFCGKLGMQVAADCVTAIDDGTLPGQWGSFGMDDEGTPTKRRLLIENGVLKSYMIDRLGSLRMGLPVTGSARRQNYRFAPTSRMTNTFIAAGKDDPEEMIRSMGEGLYAKAMGGGSVNPLTGEFNFAVSEGYWVKNGEIVTPVRGATLIGRGTDVLMKIDRVGSRMWMGQGMCGSQSGSIPTNVGQPRIRVREMTIGGKGGAL